MLTVTFVFLRLFICLNNETYKLLIQRLQNYVTHCAKECTFLQFTEIVVCRLAFTVTFFTLGLV